MGSTITDMGRGAHLGGWVLKRTNRSAGSRVGTRRIDSQQEASNMKSGGRFLAAAVVATVLCVPATANAAVTASVTGDDGNPAALTPGAPLAIRNMDVKAIGHVDPADAKGFILSVIGPDGVAATTAT